MPKFAGWISGRLVIDAVNALDAEKILRAKALELLITQAPVVTVRNITLVITTENK